MEMFLETQSYGLWMIQVCIVSQSIKLFEGNLKTNPINGAITQDKELSQMYFWNYIYIGGCNVILVTTYYILVHLEKVGFLIHTRIKG